MSTKTVRQKLIPRDIKHNRKKRETLKTDFLNFDYYEEIKNEAG